MIGGQLHALADQRDVHEVIVADNGSTDATVEVARSWDRHLPALQVIDASTCPGSGHARNVAARVATGDVLLFCDADDVVSTDWAASMTDALAGCDAVAGRLESAKLNPPWLRATRPIPQETGLQRTIGPLPHASAQNLGIWRSVFWSIDGFDEQQLHLQDTDFCWRLQLAGHRLDFAPDALVHVRLRDSARGMARQGWNYGRAQAQLMRRYEWDHPTDPAGRVGPAEPDDPADPDDGAPQTWLPRGLRRGALGAFVWQLAWHAGHRSGHPDRVGHGLGAGVSALR